MLALMDYFSKWIEADSFQQVRENEVVSFIHTNIICRFGVLLEIICDNGSQFISDKTKHALLRRVEHHIFDINTQVSSGQWTS